MSLALKAAGAQRDPLMWVATAATVLGLIQGATGFLEPVMADHPKAFGVGMFMLSVSVGTLRWFEHRTLIDKGMDAQDAQEPE